MPLVLPPTATIADVRCLIERHRSSGMLLEESPGSGLLAGILSHRDLPRSVHRGCTATTATYRLREDGRIGVLNRCRLGSVEGEERSALGLGRVVDRTTSAKLEVSFFRPFWGDYWIIELAEDYSHAVVGHPGRDSLWILRRTPILPERTYGASVARLQARGDETSRLVRTTQAPGAASSSGGKQRAGDG